jgi:hypothetical protein
VVNFYRATVDQETFGWEAEEQDLGSGSIEMRWAGVIDEPKSGDYTLVVRAHEGDVGDVRVELDVTTTGPLLSRPDVTGELGKDLQHQKIATTPGMTYVRSHVRQVAGDPSSCRLLQAWTDATGAEQAFTATKADCNALAFMGR